MPRKYDIDAVLGPDFEFELTPDILAYELSIDFSNQVIKRCAEMGLSLNELASLMGIGASTLSEKLNGQNLTLKSIASMAIALGCDVEAPELIAEPEVTCAMDVAWSLPFTKVGAGTSVETSEAWSELEAGRVAETTCVADAKPVQNYQYAANLGEAA